MSYTNIFNEHITFHAWIFEHALSILHLCYSENSVTPLCLGSELTCGFLPEEWRLQQAHWLMNFKALSCQHASPGLVPSRTLYTTRTCFCNSSASWPATMRSFSFECLKVCNSIICSPQLEIVRFSSEHSQSEVPQ